MNRCALCCADVYERLTPKGKKATFKTLLLTQLVAGVWHGLFPGYALFFATSAFMFESAKVIYRYEQVWDSGPKGTAEQAFYVRATLHALLFQGVQQHVAQHPAAAAAEHAASHDLLYSTAGFMNCARYQAWVLLQGLPQRWRFIQTFPLWQFVKFIYTGFILNYSASAFLVSSIPAVRNARAKQAPIAAST